MAQTADPRGTWVMEEGGVTLRIAECGDALCATLLTVPPGDHVFDGNEPGDVVLRNMRRDGSRWTGTIWFADDDTLRGRMEMTAPDEMLAGGCVAFICETEALIRVRAQ